MTIKYVLNLLSILFHNSDFKCRGRMTVTEYITKNKFVF